jgi:hypothetical protein
MIVSVWKPRTKKSKLFYYEMVNNESLLVKKGTTGYKVIWVCDNPNCRTPDMRHSIIAAHLIKPKMCYNTQICRPCQVTGKGNGRYGDKRKWVDFFDKDKVNELKTIYSNKWKGELNPSKSDNVKIKKNQTIITKDLISQICVDYGFELLDLIKLDGKRSEFRVQCNNGHISEKKYVSFTRKQQIWKCNRCYYDSIGLNYSDEEIIKFENYKKQVRALTAKTYRVYKSVINPDNLVNSRKKYHIDHKYSIHEGFKNNIDVKIISSKENLQMLSSLDNLCKSTTCSITLNELLRLTGYLLIKQ